MTKDQKAQACVTRLLELLNDGHTVSFMADSGDNTATIVINDQHGHVGMPGGSFEEFMKSLLANLRYPMYDDGPGEDDFYGFDEDEESYGQ